MAARKHKGLARGVKIVHDRTVMRFNMQVSGAEMDLYKRAAAAYEKQHGDEGRNGVMSSWARTVLRKAALAAVGA
jgi:hypothetical protein